MILGVHHPALSVPDMDKALAFYCGVLGFEEVMQAEIPSGIEPMNTAFGVSDAGCLVRMIRKGNSIIELFEFSDPDTPVQDLKRPVNQHGLTHICLAADDYEKDYALLESGGVVFNTPAMGEPGSRWAYERDPFGNVVELLEHAPGGPTSLRFED